MESDKNQDPFENDDIISRYGCEQAVEDGVLFHPYPDRWPWLLVSTNVHSACESTENDDRTYDQKLVPLIMDVVMLTKDPELLAKLNRGEQLRLDGTVADTVIIGINDKGGLTVCQPCEN